MVAGEYIFLVQIEVLGTSDLICDVYIVQSLVEESSSGIMLGLKDAVVDLLLVNAALDIIKGKTRELLPKFRPQHFIDIQQIFFSTFVHMSSLS